MIRISTTDFDSITFDDLALLFKAYGTVNRGYFERFLRSTLNIFYIN